MKSQKKLLIIIAGPTAVGKTACAISIAQKYKCDIISADSRQIYQEMNIGTAKPSASELQMARHHFIDFLPVNSSYNAGKFATDVHKFLFEYFQHYNLCLLAGGTGLYINAVVDGLDHFPEVPAEILEEVKNLWKQKGISKLQEHLKSLDPEYYQKADIDNPHRLIRALSVCLSTNKPYSSFLKRSKTVLPFEPVFILLKRDREELYNRINLRVDQMIIRGLTEEVHALIPERSSQAMQTVGYRELLNYFDGENTLETAIEKIKQNSRRYAKRQMTWFNNDGRYSSFHPDDLAGITSFISQKMQY